MHRQVARPRLIRACDLRGTREDPPDISERTPHLVEHAELVSLFEHDEAARCEGASQPLQDVVPLGYVQQHESRVDEVERALRKLVCGEVDLGDFAASVGQVGQVAGVSVHREYPAAR